MNAEPNAEPSDRERYPTLSDHGRQMLKRLREHPHAPMFRNQSGNRLTLEDVARVRAFEAEVQNAAFAWHPSSPPPWLDDWVARCFVTVPHFRAQAAPPAAFADLPTTSRGDLARDIARFVPDDAPVHRLINFRTTGTTGQPLLVASHPVVAAEYLGFHKRALRRFGIELRAGRGEVGVVLLGWQKHCFTYASVTPTMDESGLAKINLHLNDWNHAEDRARYLDDLAPEVYAGDPLSFAELASLPLRTRPRALLSTAMALTPGLRRTLEARFMCPVLDVYSMNEAGPIAVFDPAVDAHALLQPGMYVEILDDLGRGVQPGQRGEVTLTGGFNFCLPLLRYRTGDHASLGMRDGVPVLVGLHGRAPVRFRTMAGAWVNNIDVTHALGGLPLLQYTVHQAADASLRVSVDGLDVRETDVRDALERLFGEGQVIAVERVERFEGKVLQYSSELSGQSPGT